MQPRQCKAGATALQLGSGGNGAEIRLGRPAAVRKLRKLRN
jgi:hypothetical protein